MCWTLEGGGEDGSVRAIEARGCIGVAVAPGDPRDKRPSCSGCGRAMRRLRPRPLSAAVQIGPSGRAKAPCQSARLADATEGAGIGALYSRWRPVWQRQEGTRRPAGRARRSLAEYWCDPSYVIEPPRRVPGRINGLFRWQTPDCGWPPRRAFCKRFDAL